MIKFEIFSYAKLFRFYEYIQPYLKYSTPLEEKLPGKKVLLLAPHPDDEAIGCGGTINKHLVLNQGITKLIFITKDTDIRIEEAKMATATLNITDFEFWDFEVDKLNEKKELLANKLFNVINDYKPEIVFIPFLLDNHKDHRATNDAIAECLKKLKSEFLIYAYPVWLPVFPNVLIDISDVWQVKKSAIECYQTQLATRDYVALAEGLAKYWAIIKGRGLKYVESYFRATSTEYLNLWKKINKK